MRFPLALLAIGALLTGQLDSNPLNGVTNTHGTTHGTTFTTKKALDAENPFREADALLNKKLNTIGKSVLERPGTECAQDLNRTKVMQTCMSNVMTEVPLHHLVNMSNAAVHLEICATLIQLAECINEEACEVCKDYDELLRFGERFYQQSLDNTVRIGCPVYNKSKCQEGLNAEQYKKIVQDIDAVADDEDEDDIEETGLTATHITIIVVIGLTLILGAMLLYLIFFGPSPAESVDEGKSTKEGPSEGPSKGASKGAKSQKAKSASAPKSTKVGEPSTKSKLPSVEWSTAKSGIAGGPKSKIKSSVAETKVSSKVKSTVAEAKTASKVASKSKV